MMKKKYKFNGNKYCLWIVSLFIFSGCASQTKKENLIGIQKVRIQKLERQLELRNKEIASLKHKKWVEEAVVEPEDVALGKLKNLMQTKQWVSALKLSGELKKSYPQSIALAKYRVSIFKVMGLKKQQTDEINFIRKQRAKNQKGSRKI